MEQPGAPAQERSHAKVPVRALVVAACAVAWLDAAAVGAQDSQYWTVQYGPVAELLGGVVVGSTRDLSATFYNPGALALTEDPSLLASVESFEATWLSATSESPFGDYQDVLHRPLALPLRVRAPEKLDRQPHHRDLQPDAAGLRPPGRRVAGRRARAERSRSSTRASTRTGSA